MIAAGALAGAGLTGALVERSLPLRGSGRTTSHLGVVFRPQALAPDPATMICNNGPGSSVLRSPYNYTGSATTFTSGEVFPGYAPMPTFGAAGTDYPNATAGVIVQPGEINSSGSGGGSYTAPAFTANTIYYFVPSASPDVYVGDHWIASHVVFLGGYANGNESVLSGNNTNGFMDTSSTDTPSYTTIQYLTLTEFTSGQNDQILYSQGYPGGWDLENDSFVYNMAGSIYPNPISRALNSQAGYVVGASDYLVVKHDCFMWNAQGGINVGQNGMGMAVGDVIEYNEFAYNGYGDYPDPCGCTSTAGKFSGTLNLVFDHNYVHGGSDPGIWGDFNNAGADVSYNYIANNYGSGIMYEASYNGNFTHNVLIGNGWDSQGYFPPCPWSTTQCQLGAGPAGNLQGYGKPGGDPQSAIYLSDSGGNANFASNYAGTETVAYNTLIDNWGGVQTYQDSGRFAGGTVINQGGSPFANTNTTYYQNAAQWQGAASVTSGSTTLTTSTYPFAAFYDPNGNFVSLVQTPSCADEPCGGTSSSPGGVGTFLTSPSAYVQVDTFTGAGVVSVRNVAAFTQTGTLQAIVNTGSGWGVATLRYTGTSTNSTTCQGSPACFTGVTWDSSTASGSLQEDNTPLVQGDGTAPLYAYGNGIPTADPVTCSSATTCTLQLPATATASGEVDISTAGGCGLYDLAYSTGGQVTGSPAAHYFDNCEVGGSQNNVISHNVFSLDSSKVTDCTSSTGCGTMGSFAFPDGTQGPWWNFYPSYYASHAGLATGGLNNVWSDNHYSFSGTGGAGAGQWAFLAQSQSGGLTTLATWTGTGAGAYGQDSGSTGL